MQLVCAQKSVLYRIEYSENGTCSGVNPDPLNVTSSDFSTALDIMEQAAREGGRSYGFTTTFTEQEGVAGYVIDAVNGRGREGGCDWSFYVQSGDETVTPDVGISIYTPGDGFEVIIRYEEQVAVATITTTYVIEYLPVCSSATPPNRVLVTTPTVSSMFDVMEEAVARNGQRYVFTVNYDAVQEGGFDYVILQVSGVANNGSCVWQPFVMSPGGTNSPVPLPLSEYAIPGDGYMLTLQYTEPEEPTMMVSTTVTTPSSAAKVGN